MLSIFLVTKTPEETQDIAFRIAKQAHPGDVYCLKGLLSSGKTVFAQGFAQGLGVEEMITSPSFPIIQEYDHTPPFYHMDFYRLSGSDEVLEIGAVEFFLGHGITVIEWPDRASALLPANCINIHIVIDEGMKRRIHIFADSMRIELIRNAIS